MYTKRIICLILIILGLGFSNESIAQSRLYPKGRNSSKDIINRYYARVDSLLLNDRKLDDFAFTIRGSFVGEQGCYYDKERSELVLTEIFKSLYPEDVK